MAITAELRHDGVYTARQSLRIRIGAPKDASVQSLIPQIAQARFQSRCWLTRVRRVSNEAKDDDAEIVMQMKLRTQLVIELVNEGRESHSFMWP